MVKSDRVYLSVNSLEEQISGGGFGGEISEERGVDEGDWLVWAFRVEPRTLNPVSVQNDQYCIWITIPQIFEPLLRYDLDTIELKPFLAESYEVADDGLSVTFVLRDDVWFSDGERVTADDVVFTFKTIVDANVDAANVANQYVDVNDVVKVDERTVRFEMARPHFKLLENLSFTWSVGILPEHVYAYEDAMEFNRRVSEPVGSGPYVFERWDVGRQVVLKRNENYWGKKPALEKRIYRFITNAQAAVQALQTGDVDMVIPEPEQFAELSGDEDFVREFRCLSYWTPWTPFYYLGWNADTEFFGDSRVRCAMTHLVDRGQIVERLLEGFGKIVTGPFYFGSDAYDKTIEPWPFDIARARALLTEAGWVDTNGDGVRDKGGVAFRFTFLYSNASALYERLAKLLKDDFAKAGIDMIAEPCEWSILIGRLNDREFEAMVMGWGGDILQDPYQLWHSSQIGNRGSNYVGFADKEADALIEEARACLDKGERDKLYRRLGRILHDEQPYTFLFTRPTFRLIDKRYENVKVHELGLDYNEWYVPEGKQRYR